MELFLGQEPARSGSLFVGSKGTLYSPSDNGTSHRLLPADNFRDYRPPQPTLPRSPGHHAEWVRAPGGPTYPYSGISTGSPSSRQPSA
jgi:hypothetical protein